MTDAADGRAPPPPPRTGPGGSSASARRPSRRTRPGRRSSDVPAMAQASPVDTDSHVGLDAAALSPPPSNEEGEEEEDVTPLPPASAMLGGDGGTVSPQSAATSRGEGYKFGRRKDRGDAPGPRGRRAGGSKNASPGDASPSGTAPHLSPERDQELLEANSAALSAGRDYLADLFRTRDGLERSKRGRYSFRRMSSGGPVPDLDEVSIGEAGGGDPSSVNLHRIKGSVGGSPGEGFGSAGPSPVYDRSGSLSTPGGRCEYFDGGGSPDGGDDDDDFGFGFSTAGHGYAASFLAGLLTRRRALIMALTLVVILAAAAAAGSVGRGGRGVRGGGGGSDPPAVAMDGSQVPVEDADGPEGVAAAADGGCRDDPDFEFQSDGEVRDCAGWVGSAARSQLWPAALEERCNGPIGMLGYGGDDLLVRDYCRLSCGNCDGDADPSSAEDEAADVPTRPQGAEEQQSQQKTQAQQQPSQQTQPQTTSPPCEDETDRIDLGGGIVDDCEGWLSGFGGMVLESRCRLVQGTGLRVADYCRRSCGNCPRSAGQGGPPRDDGGPSPGQVAAPPATTAAMMSATTATPPGPGQGPGPAQPPQAQTGPSFPPGPPPQHTSGCSDDATFTFYHEDKLKDCEDWVANVGRPSLHEQRCQEPVGTRTHNGVVLRLRDYCRKSCHLCS